MLSFLFCLKAIQREQKDRGEAFPLPKNRNWRLYSDETSGLSPTITDGRVSHAFQRKNTLDVYVVRS